jgi:hypothetical protein
VRCVSDPLHYEELRQGAIQSAGRFSLERHFQILLPCFESAIRNFAGITL